MQAGQERSCRQLPRAAPGIVVLLIRLTIPVLHLLDTALVHGAGAATLARQGAVMGDYEKGYRFSSV